MSTHTPGPWTLQPIGDETECNILGAGRELIATVSDNDAPVITRSVNIAPKLAEALRTLLNDPDAAVIRLSVRKSAADALVEWDNAK